MNKPPKQPVDGWMIFLEIWAVAGVLWHLYAFVWIFCVAVG